MFIFPPHVVVSLNWRKLLDEQMITEHSFEGSTSFNTYLSDQKQRPEENLFHFWSIMNCP